MLIEKKALEDTIKVLNEAKTSEKKIESPAVEQKEDTSGKNLSEDWEEESKSQLKSLLASVSNLIAEKSHMEEAFKVNQKQLRDEKKIIENKCKELQEEVSLLSKQLKSAENKNNDYLFVRNDLKKHLKGGTQNAKLIHEQEGKSKNLENDLAQQLKNYEKEVKSLKSELEAKKMINELSEKKLKEYSFELSNLQEEVRNLQIEHQAALKLEKEKARNVEDDAKKLTAAQEERVINLETRLAELSETIGSYDRLRLQDQVEIQKLKELIAHRDVDQNLLAPSQNVEVVFDDYDDMVEKILKLKHDLQIMAIKYGKEEDFKNLFPDNHSKDVSHSGCKEEFNKMKAEFELYKSQFKLFDSQPKCGKEVVVLQNQIKNLQEKIRVLSDENKSIDKDYQLQIEQLKKTMKNEKARFKETLAASELDFRGRVWLLEEQLQKQRERSLTLLEEKEKEIHSLQSTFQMFLPGYIQKTENDLEESSTLPSQSVDGPHIVHYTNEIARRDIEISSLRRKKHQVEMALRDLQKEVVSIREKHKEEIDLLNADIMR